MNPISLFLRAANSFSLSRVTSRPSKVTDPLVGKSRLPMRLSNVLFPHPDGPVTAMVSPTSTFIVTPRKTLKGSSFTAEGNSRATLSSFSSGVDEDTDVFTNKGWLCPRFVLCIIGCQSFCKGNYFLCHVFHRELISYYFSAFKSHLFCVGRVV